MVALTTIQRDVLQVLLTADGPIGLTDLGQQVGLTGRQVQYGLRAVETWLHQRGAQLLKTPGVGVRIVAPTERKQALVQALSSERSFQLVLTAGQRQQALALQLLTTREPSILYQLQQTVDVSRTTLLKDLDLVEQWIGSFDLELERRPNFGCWIEGNELAQRQALTSLLWGDSPFGDPMFAVTHPHGLIFFPSRDVGASPIIKHIANRLQVWDMSAAMQHVATVETAIGVRFTDEAVLQLALVFAIQRERIGAGLYSWCRADILTWLQARPIWTLVVQAIEHLFPGLSETALVGESAALAMHVLSAGREHESSRDLTLDGEFSQLIATLMHTIATVYRVPALAEDAVLRDGLEAHIVPAILRQRFGLWAPRSTYGADASDRFTFERTVADQLAAIVAEQSGCVLPLSERHNLILLVRAAAIRERPAHLQRVLVCCPSGMATTQLLVARLRVRFPHLGTFEVLSIRDLNDKIADADLIISTVPLTLPPNANIAVIQVHPLLLPSDIDTIRAWIAQHAEGIAHFPT